MRSCLHARRIISISIFVAILTTTCQSSRTNLPYLYVSSYRLPPFSLFHSVSVVFLVFVHSCTFSHLDRENRVQLIIIEHAMRSNSTKMTLNDIIMLKRRNCKRCEFFFAFCFVIALTHSHMAIRLSDRMQIDRIFQVWLTRTFSGCCHLNIQHIVSVLLLLCRG